MGTGFDRRRNCLNRDDAWVVIHMAHSAGKADEFEALLTREGFLVKLRPVPSALVGDEGLVEVLTLSAEAAEARNLLVEMGY